MNLKISEEFRTKIPPLTEEEFNQLRDNIVADGEVYEPIVVWNGVIVDGHNRWKIIQEHPEIPYRVKEMQFPDEWAAFDWMYKKQLGRRNLTDEQKTYLLGKMYEARKNTRGGDRRSAEFSNAQNGPLKIGTVKTTDKETHGVSGEIAIEMNVGRNTVRRAEKFAKGVEAIRAVSPVAAEKILQGEANLNKSVIQELAKKDEKEVKAVAKAIENGQSLKAAKFPSGNTKPVKAEAFEPQISRDRDAVVEYTIDDFLEELGLVIADCQKKIRRMLDMHSALVSENTAEIVTVLDDHIKEIEKMEEM